MSDILELYPVSLDEDNQALVILDQTRLPNETLLLSLREPAEIREAIAMLRVRGAPAIGIAAAMGLYVASLRIKADSRDAFFAELASIKAFLAGARPTAVNLAWALNRMEQAAKAVGSESIPVIRQALHDEALRIQDEDAKVCRAIGEHGLTLIKDGDGILTHCNAGQLATSRYGTALAPIHLGAERGMNFHVFADETRPLLQGARLTACELTAHGIRTTLICDNMASQVMKNGWIQAVFVGADRIAANGDTANKIGTSGVAVLAKYYGIPFYVCAPLSTFDPSLDSGSQIPIEERASTEITELWYEKRMAPTDVNVYNPAFDVTDHTLITAFVTERGIIRPDFGKRIASLFS